MRDSRSENNSMGFVLGDSLGTKPCVFPCKVAPAGDERYLGCAAVADRSFWCKSVPPLCSAMSAASYVRSSMRFLNLGLQIAVEWLHECCHVVLHVRRERRVGDVRLQNAL